MALVLRRILRNKVASTCIYRHRSFDTTSVSNEVRIRDDNDDSSCFTSATYSPEEQQKILRVVNNSNLDQLTQYDITKVTAVSLIKKRNALRHFATLDDLVTAVNNVDDGYSLCDSVVHGLSIEGQKRLELKWRLCYPSISEEYAQTVNSCVVLQINSKDVTWLHLSRSLKILQWEHAPLTKFGKLQGNLQCLELARNIVSKLPVADVYLLDDHKVELRSLKMAPLVLRMVRLECMIAALLDLDSVGTESNRVRLIKNEVVAGYFRLKVGNEQVSGQKLVQDMVHGDRNSDLQKVSVDQIIWFQYVQKTPEVREQLANALLKVAAFYQLEIAKLPLGAITGAIV